MRAVEAIGHAIERACARWPGVALTIVFSSPLWMNMVLQLAKHWSKS